jgi:pimeloyl-ACP methyl ester carboxylesterase
MLMILYLGSNSLSYLSAMHLQIFPLLTMKRLTCIMLLLFCLVSHNSNGQTPTNPYQKQVKFFFPGAKLPNNYTYNYPVKFKEVTIITKDSVLLSGILFPSDSSKGVILYLHGNTGALDKWGNISKTYTSLHYDLFIMDYRGYGKSQGSIKNEGELYNDVQEVYNYLKSLYNENKIIVLGYSMGTGPAAFLASKNHPKELILQAPYYSLPDAMHHLRPSFDTAKIAFHFNTFQFLKQTTVPVIIFHGDQDKMFYYGSSLQLETFFKPGDKLITLKGAGHPFMDQNPDYLYSLQNILRN